MKTWTKSIMGGLGAIVFMGPVLLGCQGVQGQVVPLNSQEALTNNKIVLGGTAGMVYTNITTGKAVWLGDKGCAVSFRVRGTSLVTTGAIGVAFAISPDGENYTGTNNVFWAVAYPTGETWAQGWTLIPDTTIRHAAYAKPILITNNNAMTNMAFTISNLLVNQ